MSCCMTSVGSSGSLPQTHSTNPCCEPRPSRERQPIPGRGADPTRCSGYACRRLWTAAGRPLNHDPAVLLRTQDLEPIFEENSCICLFTGSCSERGTRIGAKPLLYEIPRDEAWDIDESRFRGGQRPVRGPSGAMSDLAVLVGCPPCRAPRPTGAASTPLRHRSARAADVQRLSPEELVALLPVDGMIAGDDQLTAEVLDRAENGCA